MSQPGEHGLSAGQADPTTKVGYCQPPEKHRFKPGVSGNPKGRPRKKPADAGQQPSELSYAVRKVTGRLIKASKNGKIQVMTSLEAVLRVVERQALTGNMKAASIYLAFAKVEESERKEQQRRFEQKVEYKRRYAEEIHRSEVQGYEPFIPVPNPSDMVIDSRKSEAIFNGPVDDVEKADWDRSESDRKKICLNLESLEETLSGSANEPKKSKATRKYVESKLAAEIEKLEILDAFYPPAETRRQPGFNLERWRKDKGKGRKRPMWD